MGKKDLKGSLLNRPLVIPQTRQSIPTIKSGMELYHLEDHRMPLSLARDSSNSPWFNPFVRCSPFISSPPPPL